MGRSLSMGTSEGVLYSEIRFAMDSPYRIWLDRGGGRKGTMDRGMIPALHPYPVHFMIAVAHSISPAHGKIRVTLGSIDLSLRTQNRATSDFLRAPVP